MLEELKEQVCAANIRLQQNGLVMLTWGNASAIDRRKKLIVIKPSGVPYDELTPEKMAVVDMEGNLVEGELNPSTDTPTHIALYKSFEDIGAVVHTHSKYATVWAQAGLDIIAYGTTHADYFLGDVPCTVPMGEDQINEDYEKNTGFHIAETFARRNLDPNDIPACLVAFHGPFTWGKTLDDAIEASVVLEHVANMAVFNTNFQFGLTRIHENLLDKHYFRRHGENAYYGQKYKHVKQVSEGGQVYEDEEDIQIMPSSHTVALKNESQIKEAPRPAAHRSIKPKENSIFDFDIGSGSGSDSDSDTDIGGPLDFTF